MYARIRPYLTTIILMALIVYFAVQGALGDRGFLTAGQRSAELTQRLAELKQIHAQRMDLEVRAKLLRDNELSADLLEERARSLLGFADPRDYVIRTKP